MEKLLVTQALDERDLLKIRIVDKIKKTEFVHAKKNNEDEINGRPVEEVKEKIKAAYQSIMDLIKRYDAINAAIAKSNAETMITVCGKQMTVANAIAIRSRNKQDPIGDDAAFEFFLINAMEQQMHDVLLYAKEKNKRVDLSSEQMLTQIVGREGGEHESAASIVEAYRQSNYTEVVDPLNIDDVVQDMRDSMSRMMAEIETAVKISNATTFVEF